MADEILTPKQKAFIEEYIVSLNATQAAIKAGYSENAARQIASENLSKPYIQDAIQAAIEERSKRNEITADRVLQELARIAYSDIVDYITVQDSGTIRINNLERLRPGASKAIKKIKEKRIIKQSFDDEDGCIIDSTLELDLHDKIKALELLGKHTAAFEPVKGNRNAAASLSDPKLQEMTDEELNDILDELLQ